MQCKTSQSALLPHRAVNKFVRKPTDREEVSSVCFIFAGSPYICYFLFQWFLEFSWCLIILFYIYLFHQYITEKVQIYNTHLKMRHTRLHKTHTKKDFLIEKLLLGIFFNYLNVLRWSVRNLTKRAKLCIEQNGGYFEQLLNFLFFTVNK